MADTDKYGSEPLSNHDLIRAVAKDLKDRVNIVDTTKLTGNEDVEDLFHGRGHAIIFLENPGQEVGHWVAMVRSGKGKQKGQNLIYADSYGDPLEDKNLLKILSKKYKKLEYNTYPFQQDDTNVCGRYCLILAGLNKLIPNMNITHFVDFLKKTKPKGKSYDEYVISLTKDVK